MKRTRNYSPLLIFTALLPVSSSFRFSFGPPTLVVHGVKDNSCLFSSDSSSASDVDHAHNAIDRQSDAKYDRGLSHISADLRDEDVIAYQSGTWYVDGTEVGDGSNPTVRYMQVDTIQLVWTHNCEHGVINGFDLRVAHDRAIEDAAGGATIERGSVFIVSDEYAQIGPEQVLARIPSATRRSQDSDREILLSQAEFHPEAEIVTAWDDDAEQY